MPAKKKKPTAESDSAYFLKIVLYIVLGSLWIKFTTPIQIGEFQLFGLPIGLVLGLIFASHDHFQVDRKIEYAILVIVAMVSFIIPYTGIFL
ncbi:TPA: hypothetical protein DCF80_03535 [Candidatus Saccharibacteria bacterium]|nr:hypothetical protein [Candidatus Saccharibacteria bacterium]HRK40944.1 hypothetical protein [Candidatus Saccharibacteria bacterium]